MNCERLWNRRSVLQTAGAGLLSALAAPSARADRQQTHPIKGNIKQSVCRWCYSKIRLEDLAAEAAKMGYKSIELLSADEYKVVKPYGLTCAMLSPKITHASTRRCGRPSSSPPPRGCRTSSACRATAGVCRTMKDSRTVPSV